MTQDTPAALPQAVIELLNHIEDVVSGDDWGRIDAAKWNAVTALVRPQAATSAAGGATVEQVAEFLRGALNERTFRTDGDVMVLAERMRHMSRSDRDHMAAYKAVIADLKAAASATGGSTGELPTLPEAPTKQAGDFHHQRDVVLWSDAEAWAQTYGDSCFNAGREFEAGRLAALAARSPTEAAAMAATVPHWEWSKIEARIQSLMAATAYPESVSVAQAMKQLVNELHHEYGVATQAPVAGQPTEPSPDTVLLDWLEQSDFYVGPEIEVDGSGGTMGYHNHNCGKLRQELAALAAPKGDSNG
jgi:hypothetical protein